MLTKTEHNRYRSNLYLYPNAITITTSITTKKVVSLQRTYNTKLSKSIQQTKFFSHFKQKYFHFLTFFAFFCVSLQKTCIGYVVAKKRPANKKNLFHY